MFRRLNILISKWNFAHYKRVVLNITHGQTREYLWTLLPTIVLFIIAIPSIRLLYLSDASFTDSEVIYTYKVIGHQWYWSYEYFDGTEQSVDFDSYLIVDESIIVDESGLRILEVDNPLITPVFVPIRFIISSVDVLHSWAVPSLGLKIDAVPGRLNQISTIIKRVGEFYGQCSEICGVNHGFMPIKIIAQ